MTHPTSFAKAAMSDMDQLIKKPGKQIFKTVQNLLRGLDNRMQLSVNQVISRPSYWDQLLQDGMKISQMFNALVQTYGDGHLEMLIQKNLVALTESLEQKFSAAKNSPTIQKQTENHTKQVNEKVNEQKVYEQKEDEIQFRQVEVEAKNSSNEVEALLKAHYQQFYNQQIVPIQNELQNIQKVAQQLKQYNPEEQEKQINAVIDSMNEESLVIDSLQQEVKKLNLKVTDIFQKMSSLDQLEQIVQQNEQMRTQLSKMQFQIQHIKLGGSCAMQESQIDELYNMVKEQ